MAKIKFENTYELLKFLFLKGILKGYYIAGPNDSGSGTFPKIKNTEIEVVIDSIFYNTSYDNSDMYDGYSSIDIDLKIIDDELIIIEKKNFDTQFESSGFDLYADLICILIKLKIIENDDEEVNLEFSLNNKDSFELKYYINDEEDFKELKVDDQQQKLIVYDLKQAFISKSDIFYNDSGAIDSFHFSINSDCTSYFSNEDENIYEIEANEFIRDMIDYCHFKDKSYEFEEDEIK